jgi:peptidyl-tRNA hydrolase, PTH1 family
MKIICGLGNPGTEYEGNRHNIGFMVVDALARHWRCSFSTQKFDASCATASVGNQKVLVLKPQTFMNRSGQSVSAAARFYKVATSEILIVHDELDLPFGRLQLKQGGGAGGHNGLHSIDEQLGENSYGRLRCGIDKPTGINAKERVIGHVLGDFSTAESQALEALFPEAVQRCEAWAIVGMQRAMNQLNSKSKPL